MHEILRHLPDGARVLDVGCRGGSFDTSRYPLCTVRVDLDVTPGNAGLDFVQADAASLPFRDGSFDAVMANHSLEHFEKLDAALRELGRVVKAEGSLYISVPDSSTFCDRLYRWLGRGGGHVNAFDSRERLVALIERSTGMRLAATRSLLTSFSYLNRKNRATAGPKKANASRRGKGRRFDIIQRADPARGPLASHAPEPLWLGSVLRRPSGRSRP